jgi:hypothetical protein
MKRHMHSIAMPIIGIMLSATAFSATYYSQGSVAPNTLSSWNTNRAGGGSSPSTFATVLTSDRFVVQNGHTMTTTATWNIGSLIGSIVQVESGGILVASNAINIASLAGSGFQLDNGGKYTHNNASTISGTVFSANTVTISSGSIFQVNTNVTLPSRTYSNLIINNTTSVDAAGIITVDNTLTINASCVFDMKTFKLSNGASFSSSGTGTLRTQCTTATSTAPIPVGFTWAAGSTVQYNASAAQTVVGGSYSNLSISNSGGGNASADITVSLVLTVGTSEIFDLATNRLINGGSFSNSGTGTIRTQSTNATPIPSGIIWAGTVIYNATGAQTVVGGSYNNLTISSTGTKTLAADASAAGSFTLSAASDYLAINGNHLTLNGTTSLTGAIKGSSTSKLTVGGSSGGSPTIKLNAAASDSLLLNLTLNRSGASAGLTLASNVGIIGLLTITSGAFNLNNRIVSLKSSSIASTAQLGTVGGTISYGTGSFTLERFIPDGNRSYRDLAAGLSSTTTVYRNWQENGAYPVVGNGIFITGIVGLDGVHAPSGLDQTQTGSKSMHSFVNGAWSDITNTYFSMSPYQGYRVLIRGDRNFLLSTVPQPAAMNNSTVIRINGSVITGTLNYASTGITNGGGSTVSTHALNNAVNGYTLLGNPYPAAIDWSLLSRTNMSGSYWYYDGTIGTDGAYVSWNGATNSNPSSNVNRYIQPGQAFFVQTASASPTMSITEAAKATASTLTNVFREESVNKISFTLLKNVTNRGFINMDGATVVCSSAINANASKFTNTTENLSINNWGKQLSIYQRTAFVVNDSVMLKLTKVVNGASYKIAFDTRNLNCDLQPILVDKYLNIKKAIKLNDTTQYAFTINTADTFSFSNRFKIVFLNSVYINSVTLPLTDFTLTAKRNNTSIDLSWNNGNEGQVKRYELQHATNGISFSKVHETTVASRSYSWKHEAPAAGKNYYRVKLVYEDGKTEYSHVVSAELAMYNPSITFNGSSINAGNAVFNIKGLAKGTYEVKLVNAMGQVLMSRPFVYTEATQYKLDKPSLSTAGIYTIVVINKETGEKTTKEFFIGL